MWQEKNFNGNSKAIMPLQHPANKYLLTWRLARQWQSWRLSWLCCHQNNWTQCSATHHHRESNFKLPTKSEINMVLCDNLMAILFTNMLCFYCMLILTGHVIKFMGVMLLMTQHWCCNCYTLWVTTTKCYKYIQPATLGHTGISRHRFEVLWEAIQFSKVSGNCDRRATHAQWRW